MVSVEAVLAELVSPRRVRELAWSAPTLSGRVRGRLLAISAVIWFRFDCNSIVRRKEEITCKMGVGNFWNGISSLGGGSGC